VKAETRLATRRIALLFKNGAFEKFLLQLLGNFPKTLLELLPLIAKTVATEVRKLFFVDARFIVVFPCSRGVQSDGFVLQVSVEVDAKTFFSRLIST